MRYRYYRHLILVMQPVSFFSLERKSEDQNWGVLIQYGVRDDSRLGDTKLVVSVDHWKVGRLCRGIWTGWTNGPKPIV